MDISTNGNEYFRHQLAKPLSGKGYEPIFKPYNIIIIERKYNLQNTYNRYSNMAIYSLGVYQSFGLITFTLSPQV